MSKEARDRMAELDKKREAETEQVDLDFSSPQTDQRFADILAGRVKLNTTFTAKDKALAMAMKPFEYLNDIVE